MFSSTQSTFLWTFELVVVLFLDGPIDKVNAVHKREASPTENNVILLFGCLCSILWAFIQWKMKNKAQKKYDIGHKQLVSEQEKAVELKAQLRAIATERKRFALPKTASRLNERKAFVPQTQAMPTIKKESKPITPKPNKWTNLYAQ
ncbi:hypothetical protein M3Y96_00448500 [Aphelenchoides besseyi]|nr:hypothetical protein M3Y96_00448500 [Aphelenchoides besseyi]